MVLSEVEFGPYESTFFDWSAHEEHAFRTGILLLTWEKSGSVAAQKVRFRVATALKGKK